MTNRLILILSLLMGAETVLAAPAWTPFVKIHEFQTLVNGETWVHLYNYQNSNQGCPATGWLALKADVEMENRGVTRVHSVLLEAFSTGQKVKLLLNGCTSIQGQLDFPKITAVQVDLL